MPELNVKSYNQMVETLEKMADGVQLHQAEPGFPTIINEEELRKKKADIMDLRSNYEQTLNKARMLQDEYRAEEAKIKDMISRFKSILYGFFGKKNQKIVDFGIKPFKEKKYIKDKEQKTT